LELHFKQFIKRALLGVSFPQEYICVGQEKLDSPVSIYLTGLDVPGVINVTASQIFLGYKPLIMAVTVDKFSADLEWLRLQDRVCLSFVTGSFRMNTKWKGFASDKNALARIVIRRIHEEELGASLVFLYEGEHAEHRFLTYFHQTVNRLLNKIRKQDPENNTLPGNLYDQVRTAYALPRVISVITLQDGDQMNMFPTDLHGIVNKDYYISSLRIGGKASEQVERAGMIALSRVNVSAYKNAYAMGKNHMAKVRPLENFVLAPMRSKVNQIPLPDSVLGYRELKRTHHFDRGIHRIHFYEILSEEKVNHGITLAHIHGYYAQWRLDHKMPTKALIR
jgi:flavin reductase (DIM6/NTAB) family NADH-FMN oxidoreductase RutF